LGVLSGIKNAVAFLTILNVGMDKDGLVQAAKYMPVFPVIGAIIGFIAGVSVWMLEVILPRLIAGMLGLGVLLLVTGAQHTDGLLDFGDAIMFHGSREDKIRIMHDPQTGAGGLSLGLVVLTTTAIAISEVHRGIAIQTLVASEAAAKFALLLQAAVGRSAFTGINTVFVNSMHGRLRWVRVASAFGVLALLSVPTLQVAGVASVIISVLTASAMLAISNSQFGGVTGDVLGATNDVTRLISLIGILVFSKWL